MAGGYKLALWYLKHPKLYSELGHRVLQKIKSIGSDKERLKQEAVKWCEKRMLDTPSVIRKITGKPIDESFYEKFKAQMDAGKKIFEASPVKLGGPGDLELIYHLAEHIKARKIVETGVAAGWSSTAFLLSLRNREDTLLVSTDMPYTDKDADKYVGCVVPDELRGENWRLIREPDRKGLPQALSLMPSIDMFHYDSDKTYEGRMFAYNLLWNALRPGGIMISDDIDDNFGFRDFCRAVELSPLVVQNPARDGVKYVGVLIKPENN